MAYPLSGVNRELTAGRQNDAITPLRTFSNAWRCYRPGYGRPSACQRDKTTSNQLDLLCKRAVPGRFGVVSTNEGVFMACTTQVQEIRSLRYLFEEYAFDTARRELCRGPDVIPVTPQVFDLLAYLIRHRERVVTKDDLIGAIWNGRIVSDAALTTRLNAARCAIGDSGAEQRLTRRYRARASASSDRCGRREKLRAQIRAMRPRALLQFPTSPPSPCCRSRTCLAIPSRSTSRTGWSRRSLPRFRGSTGCS